MKLRFIIIPALCLYSTRAQAQPILADSIPILDTVMVRAYALNRNILETPVTVSNIAQNDIQRFAGVSLLPALNTVAGLRMEERSPGSYRLSIRGSLLRSPFGVRNVKLYIDDIPFTDASGNTYINLIEPAVLSNVEILKGPPGSMYGAGTGGAVLMQSAALLQPGSNTATNTINASVQGGSYGLLHEAVQWKLKGNKYGMQLQQSHLQSDGYRSNSRMRRDVLHYTGSAALGKKSTLKMHLLFSDLFYQTPGGLTLLQFQDNPKQARPATASLPGAIEQKAAVYNKTLFSGFTNTWLINSKWTNVTSMLYSTTTFKNPFITNYETRSEAGSGVRTVWQYKLLNKKAAVHFSGGAELQKTISSIRNYNNKAGIADSVQSLDDVKAIQQFYFLQADINIQRKVFIQAGASSNGFSYQYARLLGEPVMLNREKYFKKALMPRISVAYKMQKHITVRSILSKGFSVPTLAEVRPSDGNFYNNLQPEKGWNYEVGIKAECFDGRLLADAALYVFKLQQAIVRRNTTGGAEYFINAGGTLQKGAEVSVLYQAIKNKPQFLTALSIGANLTLNHFRFKAYEIAGNDFSGNQLTGIAPIVLVTTIDATVSKVFYTNITFNYTSRLPLNDANTAFATAYNLLQCKLGYRHKKFEAFAGADNILNERYSLGHDINASAGRYYNAAALRNYFAGLMYYLQF
ncbi:MAG TPA: TonB-dependent receptor [Ferruginibacter sp.]|nr:TonB-dependent receptor [Ferruginibacter sp.]HMP22393.1 TonB-dependent receptor [Ferruginibacter sp.]